MSVAYTTRQRGDDVQTPVSHGRLPVPRSVDKRRSVVRRVETRRLGISGDHNDKLLLYFPNGDCKGDLGRHLRRFYSWNQNSGPAHRCPRGRSSRVGPRGGRKGPSEFPGSSVTGLLIKTLYEWYNWSKFYLSGPR